MGVIYKVTNNINGKVYIGQTRCGLNIRWKQHVNNSACENANDYNTYLHVAMRKYGIDAFSIEEIETCDNTELNDREIFWIARYNSFNNQYGYNLTLGGGGSQKYTDEEILKLWDQGMSIGDIHDVSGIDRGWISVRLKACGITDTEISNRRYKVSGNKNSMVVYQYALSGEYIGSFKSVNDARRMTGVGHIEKCCSGKQKQAGGFQWSYKKVNKIPPYEPTKAKGIPKAVLQIAEDTKKIIMEYETISSASRATGIDVSGIANVCKGVQWTAGGYCWSYKDSYQFELVS